MKYKALLFLTLLQFMAISSLFAQLPSVKLDFASYATTYEGRVIGYFGEKNRVDLKGTGNASKWVINCLVATEDRDFYNHSGVSYKGLGRAIWKTLTGSVQGGGTITMQLVRNLFLTHERTISRKLSEINLAMEVEKKYSKDQILLMYLNTVYFGHGAYGIWAAAQEYYGKTPDKLTIPECAFLIGLLQSPGLFDPAKNPDRALARRNEVLHNLVETGKLSQKEFEKYKSIPLNLKLYDGLGRFFLEHVRQEAVQILSKRGYTLTQDELIITTTLDYNIQKAAENAVNWQWGNVPAHMQAAQIGLVSVDATNGMIRAMIGGNPEASSRGINRADQIKRQPGSSFKAFLYGKLFEDGYTLITPLADKPIVVAPNTPYEWRPENSTNSYTNRYLPLNEAVQHSVNLSAAYAITNLTTPDSVSGFAHKCGITSELKPYPSLALGTSDVSPLEMAASAVVFASGGIYRKPYSILKISDKHHRVLYSAAPESHQAIDSSTAYLVATALKAVVDSGTATSVRRLYKGTAVGKTGTTQNSTDAWFVGFNPRLATAIWIGYDDPNRKLTGGFQYGGSACAPIWGKMMSEASNYLPGFYGAQFQRPSTIKDIEVCTDSGMQAGENCIHKKIVPVDISRLRGICEQHNSEPSIGLQLY